MRQTADDLSALPLCGRPVPKSSLKNADHKSEGRSVKVVNEVELDQRIQSFVCVFGWVTQSLEQYVDHTLYLGVVDHFSKALQTSVRRGADLLMTVVQDVGQRRYDLWQA